MDPRLRKTTLCSVFKSLSLLCAHDCAPQDKAQNQLVGISGDDTLKASATIFKTVAGICDAYKLLQNYYSTSISIQMSVTQMPGEIN